jgi:hypothetical protein
MKGIEGIKAFYQRGAAKAGKTAPPLFLHGDFVLFQAVLGQRERIRMSLADNREQFLATDEHRLKADKEGRC